MSFLITLGLINLCKTSLFDRSSLKIKKDYFFGISFIQSLTYNGRGEVEITFRSSIRCPMSHRIVSESIETGSELTFSKRLTSSLYLARLWSRVVYSNTITLYLGYSRATLQIPVT